MKFTVNYAHISPCPAGGCITVDGSNNIYVTDYLGHNVQKFDSNGNSLTQWGTQGSSNGQFYQPNGITTDSQGILYVADHSNDRIQKFVPVK